MEHREWLRKEIVQWQAEGIVDEGTTSRLLERYPQEGSRRSWGMILLAAFGALLVGLGVISVLAANWDCLGRGWRAVIAMTPVVGCGVAAVVASQKGWRQRLFWEPMGILWCLAVGVAACLVAQTYQLGGAVPDLILFVSLLTLPVIWMTGAVVPMALWAISPVVWANMGEAEEIGTGLWAMALMCLSLPAYIAFLRHRPPRPAFLTAQAVVGIIYGLGVFLIFVQKVDLDEYNAVWLAWGCAALLGISAWIFKLPVWPAIAAVFASVAAMPTAFEDMWITGNAMPMYVISWLLAIGEIGYGIRKVRLGYANLGCCLALWLMLVKFFASDLSFTAKGLVFIVLGVGLILLNVTLVRYRKRRMANGVEA